MHVLSVGMSLLSIEFSDLRISSAKYTNAYLIRVNVTPQHGVLRSPYI